MPLKDLTPADSGHLAEGLTEDLIVALSRHSDVTVVAMTSAQRLADSPDTLDDALAGIDATYLVSGTLRVAGDRLRVTVRLSEKTTGVAIWSDTFDRQLEELFQVQDEIVLAIAGQLPWRVLDTEAQRAIATRVPRLTTYHAYVRAMWDSGRSGDIGREESEFRAIVDVDPEFAPARSHLGFVLAYKVLVTGQRTEEEMAEALSHVRAAVHLAPHNERVLAKSAATFQFAGEYEAALRLSARAMELNPYSTDCTHFRAAILGATGDAEAAIALHQKTAALDPLFPEGHLEGMIEANYVLGRYAAALNLFQRWSEPPRHALALAAACHAMLGHDQEAKDLARTFSETAPEGFSNATYMAGHLRFYRFAADRKQWLRGFQAAGIPGLDAVRRNGIGGE